MPGRVFSESGRVKAGEARRVLNHPGAFGVSLCQRQAELPHVTGAARRAAFAVKPGGTAMVFPSSRIFGAKFFMPGLRRDNTQGDDDMIRKADTGLDFQAREQEVLGLWEERDVFQKSIDQRAGQPEFTFYDGPPTANGEPHIGHVETRVFKDVVPRYRTMKGFHVLRKAGWDTHGLPVEVEVEKMLGLDGKGQIESYGIEPFIKQCKESVWKYKGEWEKMSRRLGFWADMDHPYVTYENPYIESVWWSLKKIYDNGLLYKGHKVVPYCPRCATSLSSHEVAQGYKDVEDTSVVVKFAVKDAPGEFFLAWTTTPWTLPSNVSLVVNAKETYCRVRVAKTCEAHGHAHEEVYIMAQALAKTHFPEGEIIETFPGASLEYREYVPLFPFADDIFAKAAKQADGKPAACYVCCDDYVTLTDGTGIVHSAPAFGEDDARVGRAYGLPFVQLVDESGCFKPEAMPYAGMFVKDADALIIKALKESGMLVKAASYAHSYPFCWRCDTPLIYYARATWFIKTTAVREKLIAHNRSVDWMPDNIKEGRMGNFQENLIDWGLSRSRYWGTPLPVWVCEKGHVHVVGSVEELRRMGYTQGEDGGKLPVDENIELHKPYIDAVRLTCPECGEEMLREPDVIDCWYDAGSMPFAQWHYPFENAHLFDAHHPADYISEAIDQTRGWFYALLAISTLLFDRPAFKHCLVLGHVQDREGQKMSKHKGNGIGPWEVLDRQGADAVRWYFCVSSAPWLPSRFYHEAVDEAQRKFMGTLWNTYAFFCLYASIEGFDPASAKLPEGELKAMDRWVLSRLNRLIASVDADMDAYRVTEASRAIAVFVDELSNWYVRRCRERFWGKAATGDQDAAFQTLYHVLAQLSKLIAPFVPFMAEQMFQNLVFEGSGRAQGVEASVHLCSFPEADAARIDDELEAAMAICMRVCELGRSARGEAGLKIRQPLAMMTAVCPPLTGELLEVALDELNVKQAVFASDADAFIGYKIKPNLRTLGKKYGKMLPAIGAYLAAADGAAAVSALKKDGVYAFTLTPDGGEPADIALAEEDMLIETTMREGYAVASEGGVTVALDAALTPELIAEGFAREAVSKVQSMRRDEAGYQVTDRIRLWITGDAEVLSALEQHRQRVIADVLAVELAFVPAPATALAKAWDINGKQITIAMEKV